MVPGDSGGKIMRRHDIRKNQKGATMVEYALTIALVAVVAIGATRSLGKNIREQFEYSAKCVAGGTAGDNCRTRTEVDENR